MNDKSTPRPVLVGTALWFAVLMTVLNWLRVGNRPPGWGWVLVVVILVLGVVFGIWYERHRRDGDPDPSGERPASRSFNDLPAVQKTRLIIVTVCGGFLVLMMAALAALTLLAPRGGHGGVATGSSSWGSRLWLR
jgi:hypothetical protein